MTASASTAAVPGATAPARHVSTREAAFIGVAAMVGGKSDVFFAQRSAGANRFLLKLSYEAGGARLYAFTAAFAERVPAGLRAFLPS